MRRGLLLGALVLSACGGSSPATPGPSAPSAGALPFQATRYSLSIIGLGCGPATQQPAPSIFLSVLMRPEGSAWVAAPEKSNGTLSLTFRQGSTPVSGQLPISGSALGFADDEGPTGTVPPTATRVSFATATPFSGLMLTNDIANGTIDGPVSFTRDGATTSCAAGTGRWFLSRFSFS
jgi:hypothetical protein